MCCHQGPKSQQGKLCMLLQASCLLHTGAITHKRHPQAAGFSTLTPCRVYCFNNRPDASQAHSEAALEKHRTPP